MKGKVRFLLVILILMICLFGCDMNGNSQGNKDGKEDNAEDVNIPNEYKGYYKEVVATLNNDTSNKVVSSKVEIMSEDEFYFNDGTIGSIEFTSSDPSYISNEGRYKLNTLGKNVTIHAKVTIGEGSFEFDYVVYAKGYISEEEYLEEVYKLIPDNITTDIVFPTEESEVLKHRNITSRIIVSSNNEDIVSTRGKYTYQGQTDTSVSFKVTVTNDQFTITGECIKNVLGRHDKEYVEAGIEWLNENFKENLNATGDIELPATDDKGYVSFIYESSNQKIFNNYGEMVTFIANTEVEFIVKAKMNDYVQTATVKARTLDRTQMIDYILDRMNVDEYQQRYLVTYVTNSTTGTKFDDYGYLHFINKDIDEKDLILSGKDSSEFVYATTSHNDNLPYKEVKHAIVPWNSVNRPQMTKSSTEFITIHDTGDNYFTAEGWAYNITTDSRQVSWHFTVDDKDIYQHMPLNEVAWHAGDGSNRFNLKDTGVKYAGRNPELEFRKDNYLYINGVKSNCMAPLDGDGNYKYGITPAGLYTEMGSNGNYWINTYYYSSGYNLISTGGGNRNSIGIETCINDNTRYSETMRATANLVAHLLKMYNLDMSRVMQHRNFSGKMCPQTMIRQKTYDDWKEILWCEFFVVNNLSTAKFTYKSNNPDIVDDNGLISKYVTEDTKVSYTVKVEFEDLVVEKTYETIIKPLQN